MFSSVTLSLSTNVDLSRVLNFTFRDLLDVFTKFSIIWPKFSFTYVRTKSFGALISRSFSLISARRGLIQVLNSSCEA